jgi:RNA recognition motif-containing protein
MNTTKLYVGNFDYSTTQEQLEKLFSDFGTVKETIVIGSKGFGFVEMSSPEEAEKAIEGLDGTEFGGRTLKVSEARPKTDKPPRTFKRY